VFWKMTVPGSSVRIKNLTQPGSPLPLGIANGSSGKMNEFLAFCANAGAASKQARPRTASGITRARVFTAPSSPLVPMDRFLK
jgi:hypothetical protein